MSNFIVQALLGNNLTIYGDGSQTRCFLYVDDMTRGLIALSETSESFSGPVNLGSSKEISVGELASIIRNIINPNLSFENRPLPLDDPTRRHPDISLAKTFLNWEPEVPLMFGLQKTIDYFSKWTADELIKEEVQL